MEFSVRKVFIAFIVMNLCFHFSAVASTSVWKVSKEGKHFYLGGTIHVLTAEDHPLPVEFFTAYNEANKLFFETDLDAIQSPKYQTKIMSAMSNRDGLTLASQLDANTYRQLEAFTASRQLSAGQFAAFQPWAAGLMLTMMEYQRLGMLPDYGVDTYFNQRAQDDGKQRMGLETPEVQIAVLSSMGEIDPNEFIEYTVQDLERLPEFIKAMKAAWRNGNVTSLAKHAMITRMQSDFPDMYKTLLTNRNQHWMKQLVLLNEDANTEFVLVGALHLYGDEGLLELLKKVGFNVTQL